MASQVVHTGKHVEGQIYLPEINWGLCLLGIAAIAGFRSTGQIGYAFSERSASLTALMPLYNQLDLFLHREPGCSRLMHRLKGVTHYV